MNAAEEVSFTKIYTESLNNAVEDKIPVPYWLLQFIADDKAKKGDTSPIEAPQYLWGAAVESMSFDYSETKMNAVFGKTQNFPNWLLRTRAIAASGYQSGGDFKVVGKNEKTLMIAGGLNFENHKGQPVFDFYAIVEIDNGQIRFLKTDIQAEHIKMDWELMYNLELQDTGFVGSLD